jgi:hypothetical protein
MKCIYPEIKYRTLEDLCLDHKRFMENGGLKSVAKNFNNVINEPILKIPLDQVIFFLFTIKMNKKSL